MLQFDKIKVGEKLQNIRKEKNLVLRDLVCSELSLTTLSRIESGYPFISREKYELFAEKLGETLENIIRNETSEDIQRRKLKGKLVSIEHYIDFGKVDEALEQLSTIGVDSQNLYASTLHFLKGKCFVKLKKWKKAKKELLEAIHLAKQNAETDHLNVASISYNYMSLVYFFEDEDFSNALKYVDNALLSHSLKGDRSYLKETFEVNKAFYLISLQRFREAFDIITVFFNDDMKCIQLADSKATACELMARIYLNNKNYDEALYYVLKGLEIGRTNHLYDQTFGLWNILGKIQLEMGKIDEAESSFKTALGFRINLVNDQLTAATFTEMGYLYLNQKNWDAAKVCITQAVEIAEGTKGLRYIEALIALGELYMRIHQQEKAVKPYEKALEIAKQHKIIQKEYIILIKLCNAWKLLDRKQYIVYLELMHKVQTKIESECRIPC